MTACCSLHSLVNLVVMTGGLTVFHTSGPEDSAIVCGLVIAVTSSACHQQRRHNQPDQHYRKAPSFHNEFDHSRV